VKFYPFSVLNARLHMMLLQMLRRPANEISTAQNRFLEICLLRGISPEQAEKFTMSEDDEPVKNPSIKQ
jgi:hypothetical protein